MVLDIRSERNPRFLDYVITNMDVRTTRSRLLEAKQRARRNSEE